jgi:lipoprotein-releasing system permease protein
MGYAWTLGIRYLRSKKRASISVGTLFAILGVALGVAALATVMSVTGGFQKQFRDKVLGVNAHVLVLKRHTPDFSEYRDVMDRCAKVPGVTAVAPFVINPMLVTAGDHTATGVLMKGVDPALMPAVLDLPKQVREPVDGARDEAGAAKVLAAGLRRAGATPPLRPGQHAATAPTGSAGAGVAPAPAPAPSATVGSADAPLQHDPLLKTMEETVADMRRRNEELDKQEADDAVAAASASANPGAIASAAPAGSAEPPPAPSGGLEPTGGYASELPPDDVEDKVVAQISKDEQARLADKDLPGVAIGRTLAKSLGVGLGDRIRITSPSVGFVFGSAHAPVARSFRVIALFEAGFDQYDSKLVYVDLYEAQAFYDQGDSVTGVEMRVADIGNARKVRDQVEKQLSNGVYHVMDWEELNHPLFTALKIQQIGMSAVLALIIVVAAFTVIATLIMIVLDKTKEIAVLKAMGARDGAILRAFLYQGLVIGAVGTALGLALGFAVCRGLLVYGFPLDPKVYFISRLPVEVRPQEFLLTGLIAILICLAATVVPALHAAHVRPADGLRAH